MSLIHYLTQLILTKVASQLSQELTFQLVSPQYFVDDEMPLGDDELFDEGYIAFNYCHFLDDEFFLPVCEELVKEW